MVLEGCSGAGRILQQKDAVVAGCCGGRRMLWWQENAVATRKAHGPAHHLSHQVEDIVSPCFAFNREQKLFRVQNSRLIRQKK